MPKNPEKPEKFMSFFPYSEFKPQQLPVMEFVSDVVEKEGVGLIEAYCGFGKTISTLAPVFDQGKKVLLLSPTHTARNAGIAEALRINKVNGKKLMVADLRSKGLMCDKFDSEKFSYEACWKSRKFDDCKFFKATRPGKELSRKAKNAVTEIKSLVFKTPENLFSEKNMQKEPVFFQEAQKVCRESNLCFYELMKQIVQEADVVVLDYYWCFTEIFAFLRNLINPKDFVLLVDEADLLIDRLYNQLHAKLSLRGLMPLVNQTKRILKFEKEQDKEEETLSKANVEFLEEFTDYTAEILRAFPSMEALEPQRIINYYVKGFQRSSQAEGLEGTMEFEDIIKHLEEIISLIDESNNSEKARTRPQSFLRKLAQTLDSKQHLTFITDENKEIFIKPFEINSETLGSGLTTLETLKQFHSAILFSATIGDENLFMEEFGLDKEQTDVFKLSCLPHENLVLIIDTELDSTFKKRMVNASKYVEKVELLLKEDPSLLVSCCNQFETDRMIEAIPGMESAQDSENLDAEKSYAMNIRTKHARSTNKASKVRNCMVMGLPLPDYSDFYFKQRKKYLEEKYGRKHAGKLINRKAVDLAVQLMGRITRDLKNPKALILADKRYRQDYFLHGFYFEILPEYFRPYVRLVRNNRELKDCFQGFWKTV
jgi:Rad3-related DNA helicase